MNIAEVYGMNKMSSSKNNRLVYFNVFILMYITNEKTVKLNAQEDVYIYINTYIYLFINFSTIYRYSVISH